MDEKQLDHSPVTKSTLSEDIKYDWYNPRGWTCWPPNWQAVSALALVAGLILGYLKFDDMLSFADLILEENKTIAEKVNSIQDDVSELKKDMKEVKITIKDIKGEEETDSANSTNQDDPLPIIPITIEGHR